MREIPIDRIVMSKPLRPVRELTGPEITEPIKVFERYDGKYYLIDGLSRVIHARDVLKLTTIPAVII